VHSPPPLSRALNTISPADLWISNNCEKNECHLGIRWDAKQHQIDLAIMKINLSTLEDLNQYQWKQQNNQINLLKNKFHNEVGILEKFDKSLLYINLNVLYTLPPVEELIQ
jgi:hypothetical protein